jgi:hypothetical protein
LLEQLEGLLKEAELKQAPEDAPESERGTRLSSSSLFRMPEAHPLVLDLVLLKKYGPEWLGWELETLELRIREDFRSPSVSDLNIEKLQACKTLHLVDTFWLQWEVFLACTVALSGSFFDHEVMQIPSVAECAIAVDIARRIREDVPWSEEVKRYLGVVHRHDDILCTQPPLEFVEIDTEGLPLDCAKVKELWPEARWSGEPPRADSIEAEQVRRMLEVYEALEQSRTRFRQQMFVIHRV